MKSNPSRRSAHRVLILGRVATAEMRPVRDAVFANFGDGEMLSRPSAVFEDAAWAADWSPGLIVVCQSQPDEFTVIDVQALFRRFPLSRWICAAGLWCESDGRNRDAWPVGVRVPAGIAEDRLRIERAVLDGEISPLPLTAGREEAFEFDAAGHCDISDAGRLATVDSPDRALRQRFEDDLRSLGFRVAEDGDEETRQIILWDADPWDEDRLSQLRRWRADCPDAAIVALSNFAPPEDESRLRQAGADAVRGKLTTAAGLQQASGAA